MYYYPLAIKLDFFRSHLQSKSVESRVKCPSRSWSVTIPISSCCRWSTYYSRPGWTYGDETNTWVFRRIRGTPKWMVYNGKTLLKWMIWGYHYFRKHPHKQTITEQKQQISLQSFQELGPWLFQENPAFVKYVAVCLRLFQMISPLMKWSIPLLHKSPSSLYP